MSWTVNKTLLKHAEGTKAYEAITLVHNPSGQAVHIRRWSKMGAWGQVQIDRFSTESSCMEAHEKIVNTKHNRGYENEDFISEGFANLAGVKTFLGRYMNHLEAHKRWSEFVSRIDSDEITTVGSSTVPSRTIEKEVTQPENWGSW